MLQVENRLVYHDTPVVEFGGNFFINVPVILQYEDTPLVEVVDWQLAGFTTQFSIYSKDGVYLAKAKGSQLYRTPDGEKAGVTLRYEDRLTVCEIAGKTAFEIRRTDAAAVKTWADLYTPTGMFLRGSPESLGSFAQVGDNFTQLGGMVFVGCTAQGSRIGFHVHKEGRISFG